MGALLSLQQGTSPERCSPGRCARGRASGQDEWDQIAEEHSQGKATKTPLQKYLGKAAEQTLNQNPGVTAQQKPHISFMNYLTACLKVRKYTPNPAQTTKDALNYKELKKIPDKLSLNLRATSGKTKLSAAPI